MGEEDYGKRFIEGGYGGKVINDDFRLVSEPVAFGLRGHYSYRESGDESVPSRRTFEIIYSVF